MSIIKEVFEEFVAVAALEIFVVVLGLCEVWDVLRGRQPRQPFDVYEL